MPRKEVFNLTIDVGANISQAQSAAKSLQEAFSKVNLTDSLKKGLDKTFGDLERELNNFASMTSKPFTNMKDVEKAEKSYEKIVDLFHELSVQGKTISGMDPSKFLSKETITRINTLQDSLKKIRSSINDTNRSIATQNKAWKDASQTQSNYQQKISEANSKLKSLQGSLGASTKKIKDLKEQQADLTQQQAKFLNNRGRKNDPQYQQWRRELQALQKEINGAISNQSSYQKKIAETKSQLNQYNNAEVEAGKVVTEHKQKLDQLQENLKNPEGLTQLREEIAKIQGVSLDEVSTDADELEKNITDLSKAELAKIVQGLVQIGDTSDGLVEASGATKGLKEEVNGLVQEGGELNEVAKEVQRLGEQAKQFFSIGNTIQLFKRAVRDAMNTVKELDATMTETATVTDFSISDMWEQLPHYTDEANKLGTSINSLYKATTLYYQQGLQTEEAMALGIETIKMARVANMDAAQATDLMTAALRGFNMELNKTSAIRVNDVYSELAAVTAADTDEIGIAISKTASIAHSANMEFETTAAFLSQIIETTREAPETAGTAMKTIIARFSEVKKLYSEGQILGTDEEGEAINVNKIQEALRTVGIDMTKFFVGAEGLDDVLLRLAEKWYTLDVATQRYIATQAAGSRQQSRFLAMMSDYDRTMELVDAAYDSAGSGQAQFEKTLDSMQAKLTELKNAWDQFVMGLANNELLKTGVDLLTSLLSVINKVVDALSGGNGLIKSAVSLGASFLALRGGAKLFGSDKGGGLIGKALGIFKGKETTDKVKKTGIEIGEQAGESIVQGILLTKEKVKDKFTSFFSKENFGIGKEIINRSKFEDIIADNAAGLGGTLTTDQIQVARIKFETEGWEAGIKALQDFGVEIEAGKYSIQDWNKAATAVGQTLVGVGAAFTVLGTLISKSNKEIGESIAKFGTLITTLGGVISVIPGVVSGIKAISSALGVSGGVVGVVIAAISALIGLFVLLANSTPEKQLERAQKKAEESAKAAQEAQQAYDDLLSNRNNYTELEDKVKSLTEGTREWTEAVRELNSAVLELSQKYEGLEIVVDNAGNLSITDKSWGKVQKQQEKELQEKQFTAGKDAIDREQKRVNLAKSNSKVVGNSGNTITEIQYKENGEIDQDWIKSQGYAYAETIDLTEAEKGLEREYKNLITQFAAYIIDDKNQVNQVSAAMSTVLGDSIKDIKTPEEMEDKINEFYNKFSQLSETEQKVLGGQLTLVDFKSLDFSALGDEYKDEIEALEKELSNRLESTRQILSSRLFQGNRTETDKFIKEYGVEISEKLGQYMQDMSPMQADQYLNTWRKIFENKGKDVAEVLLDFDVTDFTSLTNLTDYMREQGLDEDLAEEYWRAMVNGAEEFTITYGQIASWSESIRNNMKETIELIDRLESGKLSADDLKTLQNAGLDTSNRLLTPNGYKVYGIDSQEARRALNQQNADKAQSNLDMLKSFDPTKIRMGDRQAVEQAEKLLNLTRQKGETDEEYAKRIKETWEQNLQIAEETNDYAQAGVYTADEMAARGGSAQQIRYSAMQEASDAGLDVDELITYSEKLQELHGIEQSMADRIALDNMKMNTSIKELSDSWDEWGEALKNPSTGEYAVTLDKLQKNMRQLLGIDADLSESFLTNVKNMELMEKAAEGDADAIDALRKEAAKELALGVDFDKDGIDTAEQNLLNALDGFDPNIKIGATLDDAQLTESFNALLRSGQMTAEDINKALEAIGFEPELTYEEVKVDGDSAQRIRSEGGYYLPDGTFQPVSTEQEVQSLMGNTVRLPVINGKATKYKGGGSTAVNPSNKSKGGKKKGGSKKQNNWKNPYDKYYNLTEKINEALRTREKIERNYDRILKRREHTVGELLKNSAQEVANLRQEVQYQKQLQAGRREQIENLANARYDNEDKRTTFEKMGVTKYARYNFDTQSIEIDWASIEAVRDEKLGKAIEAYVGQLEELSGQFEDTQDTIEEMEDTIWEINQRGKEEYLNFEQRVIDALVNQRQKEIDTLSDRYDSINESNSNILDSLRESVELSRQIRDNTKTEDEIAQKEARLAYLRRDTSGANATEIMKLEKELNNMREDYADSLVDQEIDKLSKQNENAAKQRDQQIRTLQAQLDYDKQMGAFNQKSAQLIKKAIKSDGSFNNNSELIKLLKQTENFGGLSEFGQQNWIDELTQSYKKAMEGFSNFREESARLEYSKKSPLSLETGEQVWFDNIYGRWVDAANNLYDIQYNPATESFTRVSKTSAEDADGNAWLKKYLEDISRTLGNSGTNTSNSSSGSGGSGGRGSVSRYKFDVSVGKSRFKGSGYTSKTSAANALKEQVQNEMNILERNGGSQDANQWSILKSRFNQQTDFKKYITAYKSGGLNTQTGLAWLDGTLSRPELILNARDTENFIELKNILAQMKGLNQLQNGGDNYYNFDIKVDQLANDYDVDKLINKVKQEIDKDSMYRNVNSIRLIR